LKATLKAIFVLAHLVFLGGMSIAAVDFFDYLHRSSESWSGIFFYLITYVLGFPWWFLITVVLVASGISPTESASAWLMWVGLLINYFLLTALTVKVWKRNA
jgi:hypothetical protein